MDDGTSDQFTCNTTLVAYHQRNGFWVERCGIGPAGGSGRVLEGVGRVRVVEVVTAVVSSSSSGVGRLARELKASEARQAAHFIFPHFGLH